MFGAVHLLVGQFQISLVGRVEQAQHKFDPKHITHAVVNGFHADSAFLDQFTEREHKRIGRAECAPHVQSRFNALADRFFHVLGCFVFAVEIFYGITV